jgi:hypothetical protein
MAACPSAGPGSWAVWGPGVAPRAHRSMRAARGRPGGRRCASDVFKHSQGPDLSVEGARQGRGAPLKGAQGGGGQRRGRGDWVGQTYDDRCRRDGHARRRQAAGQRDAPRLHRPPARARRLPRQRRPAALAPASRARARRAPCSPRGAPRRRRRHRPRPGLGPACHPGVGAREAPRPSSGDPPWRPVKPPDGAKAILLRVTGRAGGHGVAAPAAPPRRALTAARPHCS